MKHWIKPLTTSLVLATLVGCNAPGLQNTLAPLNSGLRAGTPQIRAKWVTRNKSPKIAGELVVQFRSGFNTKQVAPPVGARYANSPNRAHQLNINGEKFALVKLRNKSEGNLAKTLSAMRKNPAYSSVEYNPRYHALVNRAPRQLTRFMSPSSTPKQPISTLNDALSGLQWSLPKIGVPQAWNFTQGSNKILVAVIDSGIDYNHPDLKGQIVNGKDFMAEEVSGPNGEGSPDVIDDDPMDGMGHGTHVAGIIGAIPNNQTGIAGIAPQVKILNIKALSAEGWGSAFAIAQGITYAVDRGARVINMSLGSAEGSKPIELAIKYALSKKVILIAAAGNEFTHTGFPANYPGVIAVGATDDQDWLADFSNHDKRINVVAPGVDIMSTTPTFTTTTMSQNGIEPRYSVMSGTSMACPMVSAQAALLLSQNPNLTPFQVKELIEKTAKKVGDSRIFGHGRIQITESLKQAAAIPVAPPAATPAPVSAQRRR